MLKMSSFVNVYFVLVLFLVVAFSVLVATVSLIVVNKVDTLAKSFGTMIFVA